MKILEQARQVLEIEANGILNLIQRIGPEFEQMIDLIYSTPDRVIISGIGKSGLVGRKIVATLNSTGTLAIFLHPAEAMHGDLGMVSKGDVFIALSNSGETDEVNHLIPTIRKIGCHIIAFTGNTRSTMAKLSDIVIDTGVAKEACPLGLAPTASTTALLAMGDALAVVLLNKKEFKSSDYKKNHPGGNLGQRLSSNVAELMMAKEAAPLVTEGQSIADALHVMDSTDPMGCAFIVSDSGILKGIITDGDLRRILTRRQTVSDVKLTDIMTSSPKTVHPASPAYDALNIMEQYQITVLPVTDGNGTIMGLLHLHDILGKGEFKFNGA